MPGNCEICSGYMLIPVYRCLVMEKLGYNSLWVSMDDVVPRFTFVNLDESNPARDRLLGTGREFEIVDQEVRHKSARI